MMGIKTNRSYGLARCGTLLAAMVLASVSLSAKAEAQECWAITGWASNSAPGFQNPGSGYERAVVQPTDCGVTPPERLWLEVNQTFAGATTPSNLHILVDRMDTFRTDAPGGMGTTQASVMRSGLLFQGRFMTIPLLWRPFGGGADDVLTRYAPNPSGPLSGALVMLAQRATGDTLLAPALGSGPLTLISDAETFPPTYPWTTGWGSPSSGVMFELVDMGTNVAGQQLWGIRDVIDGRCPYVHTASSTLLMDYCTSGGTGVRFVLEPVSGGYRIRSNDVNACWAGVAPVVNNPVGVAACTGTDTVYDLITLQRGIAGGGPPPPPRDEEVM